MNPSSVDKTTKTALKFLCPAHENKSVGRVTFFLLCCKYYINWFCLEMYKGICTKSRWEEAGEQEENSFGEQWADWMCCWETPEHHWWEPVWCSCFPAVRRPQVLHKHKTHCKTHKSCFVYGCSPLVAGVLTAFLVCCLFFNDLSVLRVSHCLPCRVNM